MVRRNNTILHELPFLLEYNGDINLDMYFDPTPSKTEPKLVEASFRGRCIAGTVVELPQNSHGTHS